MPINPSTQLGCHGLRLFPRLFKTCQDLTRAKTLRGMSHDSCGLRAVGFSQCSTNTLRPIPAIAYEIPSCEGGCHTLCPFCSHCWLNPMFDR